jgi:hypothetical protein
MSAFSVLSGFVLVAEVMCVLGAWQCQRKRFSSWDAYKKACKA